MPPILIDVTRLFYRRLAGRGPTGVDRVGLEYVRRYQRSARAVLSRGGFHVVLSQATSRVAFAGLIDPDAKFATVAARIIGRTAWRCWSIPDVAGGLLFNTGHLGLEDPGWAAPVRRRGAHPIFFVHDLIPIRYPEYCRRGEHERHVARMRNALASGCGIIANSRATLAALDSFAQQMHLKCPPMVVAPLAPAALGEAGPRPLVQPYFVILGTIEPRKNHGMLLQVWRTLVERFGEEAPRLVVIGRRGWECENVVDLLERSIPLRGVVRELNACSDRELASYLLHAQALLMPSFAEGYGLPVVEALAVGIPVIASDLPVFREVVGDVPDYADPLDGPRWTELVCQYRSSQSAARRAQLTRLASYRAPTWGEHFLIVDEFVQRLRPHG